MDKFRFPWKQVVKVWGLERWLRNDEYYCMKELRVLKGFRCSVHHHKKKTETFYIVSGKVWMEMETPAGAWEGFRVGPGDHVHIPVGTKHRFSGMEQSVMIECSTQHFDEDSYRDTESGRVPDDGKTEGFTTT